MITILKYKSGNVSSIVNMLNYLGYFDVKYSNEHKDIIDSDALILPGVGNFDYAVENLHKENIFKLIKNLVQNKKKIFLGICLGMQLIFNKSDEGNLSGFNFIDGNVHNFNLLENNILKNIKVPHIGWNKIQINSQNSLLKNIKNENRFYFAHSYYAKPSIKEVGIAQTNYGISFPSIVNSNNIYGVQFHPEKSLNDGKKIFNNFIEIVYARKKNHTNIITA